MREVRKGSDCGPMVLGKHDNNVERTVDDNLRLAVELNRVMILLATLSSEKLRA